MIRVSAMYPHGDKFDEEYYAAKHMPLVAEKCGGALIRYEIDKGVAGAAPGQPAPYVTIGHMYFNSVPEFMAAMAPHMGAIMGDIPNFTDAKVQLQISEIVKG